MKTSIYLPDDLAEQARERGISLSEITQSALRGALPDNAFVSIPEIGDVRGIPGMEPVLQVTLHALTGGLPDGASALFLVTALLQADNGPMIDLGTAEPLLKQLSYGKAEPHKFPLYARWRLSAAAIERIEQARDGGGFMLQVTAEYGLMGGTTAPDWRQPHRPIRGPYPDVPGQKIIKAHDWALNVLEQWQQAAAVSLVIPLPQSGATDEHRTIVARLATARQEIDQGHWKPSISATREAVELLRKMRPDTITPKAQDRVLGEREAAILDRLAAFIHALFDYESAASHPDPHLRSIAWSRENAMLALGSTASVAQLIFANG
jgi:hypothetical protein